MLDEENPGNESFPGSLIITEQVPSLLICVSTKLICVLVNKFMFWKIDLCFGKLFCVLVN